MSDNNAPQQQRNFKGQLGDVALYDDVHSAITISSLGDNYSNALMLDVRARDSGSTEGQAKYLTENTFKITFTGAEAYKLKLQLRAFIDGQLNSFEIVRELGGRNPSTKVLTFCRASELYDDSNPEMAERCANGLAIYADENGSATAFVCYGDVIQLADGADPVLVYPEMELLYNAFDQITSQFLRLDGAAVRSLLNRQSDGGNGGRTNTAAQQPSLGRRPSIGGRTAPAGGGRVASRPGAGGATQQAADAGNSDHVSDDEMSQFVD